jgi:hypothetical protein
VLKYPFFDVIILQKIYEDGVLLKKLFYILFVYVVVVTLLCGCKASGQNPVNYNPADGDDVVEGAITVAEGYTVVSEAQANGDIWYTVVAE